MEGLHLTPTFRGGNLPAAAAEPWPLLKPVSRAPTEAPPETFAWTSAKEQWVPESFLCFKCVPASFSPTLPEWAKHQVQGVPSLKYPLPEDYSGMINS